MKMDGAIDASDLRLTCAPWGVRAVGGVTELWRWDGRRWRRIADMDNQECADLLAVLDRWQQIDEER